MLFPVAFGSELLQVLVLVCRFCIIQKEFYGFDAEWSCMFNRNTCAPNVKDVGKYINRSKKINDGVQLKEKQIK